MSGEALGYRNQGISVVPCCKPSLGGRGCLHHGPDCQHPGKTPIIPWTAYQHRLPTEDEIRSWFSQRFEPNIAMVTGKISNRFVVDIDGAEGLAAIGKHGVLPRTRTVRTGRPGGTHYHYHSPSGLVIPSKVGLVPRVDVRGEGGIAVVPPSLHPSGSRYEWDQDTMDYDFAEPPLWLLDLLLSPEKQDDHHPPLDVAATLNGVPEGERDTTLFRLASKLRAVDIPREIAERLILEAAANCDPPFPEAEARAKVASAYKRYQPNPGVPDSGQVASQVKGSRSSSPTTFTATELATRVFPEPKMVVPGILVEGGAILAGPPKIGKSWLMLDISIAVAEGGLALGALEVEAGDVLYLALEDGERRLQKRLKAHLGDEPHPDRLHLATSWPAFDQGGLGALDEWLAAHPDTRLVIIDTLKRVRPREQRGASVYGQDYDAIAPLADLARLRGICILVVHHTRKLSAEDPMDRVSGSLGLSGAADCVLVLRRPRGERVATLMIMGRDIEERELPLVWKAPRWQLVDEDHDPRRSSERQAIIGILRQKGPLGPKEIAESLGKNRATVRWLLREMAESGELKSEGGKYEPAPPRTSPLTRRTPPAQSES